MDLPKLYDELADVITQRENCDLLSNEYRRLTKKGQELSLQIVRTAGQENFHTAPERIQ